MMLYFMNCIKIRVNLNNEESTERVYEKQWKGLDFLSRI